MRIARRSTNGKEMMSFPPLRAGRLEKALTTDPSLAQKKGGGEEGRSAHTLSQRNTPDTWER